MLNGPSAPEPLTEYTSPEGAVVTHVRSTLLSSSVKTLKERGLFERYVELLPEEYYEPAVMTLAPEWLPIDVGMAHYGACDQLGLSDEALDEIGELVAERIMGTFLAHILRSTRSVGASPWLALKRYSMLWGRLMRGGRCEVFETGPKDARVDSAGMPTFRYRYFRTAYLGVVKGACGMFAKKVFVNQEGRQRADDQLSITVSWV